MIATDELNVVEGYVARDLNESLFFFIDRPTKFESEGVWEACKFHAINAQLPSEMFPNLMWEDKPIKVELTLKLIA